MWWCGGAPSLPGPCSSKSGRLLQIFQFSSLIIGVYRGRVAPRGREPERGGGWRLPARWFVPVVKVVTDIYETHVTSVQKLWRVPECPPCGNFSEIRFSAANPTCFPTLTPTSREVRRHARTLRPARATAAKAPGARSVPDA
jgi:hypothetical protein